MKCLMPALKSNKYKNLTKCDISRCLYLISNNVFNISVTVKNYRKSPKCGTYDSNFQSCLNHIFIELKHVTCENVRFRSPMQNQV